MCTIILVMYLQYNYGSEVRGKFIPNKDTPASDAIYRRVSVPGEQNESQQTERQRFAKLDLGDELPHTHIVFRLRQRLQSKAKIF